MTLSKRGTTFKRFFLSLLFAAAVSLALAFAAQWSIRQMVGGQRIELKEFYVFAAVSAGILFLFTVRPANRPMRFFKNIGRLLLILILVAAVWGYAFFWVAQNAFLFPPVPANQQAEEALKAMPHAEQISIPGGDGAQYNGWLIKNGQEKAGLLLYFGGNDEEAAGRAQSFARLMADSMLPGYHVLAVDYPGTGHSGGERSEETIYAMAQATWEYAVKRPEVNPEKMVLAGWSLGTGTAIRLAGEKNPAGLILFAPYFNCGELASSFAEKLFETHIPVPLPIRNPYRSNQYARNVQAKTLVVAARDDNMVPYDQSQRLAALLPQGQLVTLESGGHKAMWSDQISLQAVHQFLGGL
ncbi:MAG: alpha/beta hydrolase [Christensenellales bacterium]|jgi:dienelactone hydrolase